MPKWRNAIPALLRFCIFALLLSPTLGCMRAHAKTAPEGPPLEVPAPPPRAVDVADAEPPPPVSLPAEPPRRTPVRPPVRPTPPPRTDAGSEATRSEPKAEPPAVETPKPPEDSPRPATLQTTPAATEAELERSIRGVIAKAASDLNRVDYRTLNAEGRTQYDTAKRFIQQTDDAIRMKNLVFAKNLADKAAALAAQLAPR